MAEISKTPKKGLNLPEHYDPSVDKLRENMTLIDAILQKAVPNDLTSTTDPNAESNMDTLTTTGRYLTKAIKSPDSSSPFTMYAGVVDVFKAGTYILQEWRSINTPAHVYRRVSLNNGSSWEDWIKDWNESNDGSRSGLDAELLGGHSIKDFYGLYHKSLDFNSAIYEGKCLITSNRNAPVSDCNTWICITYYLDSKDNLYQIAMKGYDEKAEIYVRRRYNGTWYSWQRLWHSGNDGDGSGLNADKLDYKQASAFAQTNTTTYTNFNSVPLVAGMYGADGKATNAPVSSTGTYTVIVTKTPVGYMMLAINTTDSHIYRRHTTGAWSASTSWVTIGGK